jgi:glycosyltransferase involved in cell wall biosynthesis
MKIALYYPWVYLRSGCERTIAELLARSRHDWTVFTNRYEPESTFDCLRQANIVELPRVSVDRSFSHVARAAWRIGRQKLPLEGHDALVVFCEGLGDFTTFRNCSVPAVCVCFTPLRAAFDPYYQQGYLALKKGGLRRRAALKAFAAAFRAIDRTAWRKYERVFAISQEVRRRILRGRLCGDEKVKVIYPGIDPSRLTPTGVYEREFLVPGRIMWTKNLELAIDSFLLFLARRPDLNGFRLTFAGFVDEKSRPYVARLRQLAADCPQIRFIESPSDEELVSRYQSAYAIVYTPFNEDWGLVPLEAMALEKPVIALNRGGPLETVVDGHTGYLVEPTPDAFARAMETLADDPGLVRAMGIEGRKQAMRFDWKFFCDELDSYLDQVAVTAAGKGDRWLSIAPSKSY